MRSVLPMIALLILAIFSLYLLFQISDLNKQIEVLRYKSSEKIESKTEVEFEVAVYMARIQLHFAKLYKAGMADNKELAKFYVHEIKESMEAVAHANIIDEGVNISEEMEAYGVAPMKLAEQKINQQGLKGFPELYSELINSCNACHKVSKHAYINIKIPGEYLLDNQNFAK